MTNSNTVIIEGKRYVKPAQVAQRLGLSRATVYRRLPKLQAAGVEIRRTSERVTLVNEADLERYLAGTGLQADVETHRLSALRQAQNIRALIRKRHGPFPDGSAAKAVREGREEFRA